MSGTIQTARERGLPVQFRSMAAVTDRAGRLSWYRVASWSFLILVTAPSLLTAIYYAFVAAPQYQATVRLAVYAIGKDTSEAVSQFDNVDAAKGKSGKDKAAKIASGGPRLGGSHQVAAKALKLMNSVFSNKSDGKDAFIVVNYIRSRTLVSDLDHDGWLSKVLGSEAADPLARLSDNASREALWRNLNTRVDAQVDSVSRLITVNARAFSPQEAQELANRIVAASEKLINEVRARTLNDATAMASEMLSRAEMRYLNALSAMRRLRDEVGVIDPAEGAMALAKALTELKIIKAALETQYAGIVASVSRDSPMARGLAARIAATDAEIADLERQIVGAGANAGAVSTYLAEFETRETERMLAQAAYEQAVGLLDHAQSDADRQGIYLAVFEPAEVPEESRFPRGWRVVLTVFVVLAALWAMFCVIGAGVRDQVTWR